MPCYDAGPSYNDSALDKARESLRKQKERLDNYARLLCFVCEYLPAGELEKLYRVLPDKEHGNAGKDLKAWWTEHQEFDRKRKEKEAAEKAAKKALLEKKAREAALKTAALRKLTSEERQVLGLS